MKRKHALVIAAILIQMVVLGATWQKAYYPTDPGPNSEWKKIHLSLQPVDPRSLFQGNYVQLRYAIHTIPRSINNLPKEVLQSGRPLYVTLEQQGEVWVATKLSAEIPDKGVFIRGRNLYWGDSGTGELTLTYGIEQFFAPKEEAETLERRTRRNWGTGPSSKMLAEVVVNREGRAGLVDIVPASE